MALLNVHCTGYWYFKDPSIVFMDILCFNFTVARPNKNKKVENSGISQSAKKLLKQMSMVPIIFWITKQHILKGFLLKLKIIKVVFKIIFGCFCQISGWSLLWTTIRVHDRTANILIEQSVAQDVPW